MTTTEDRKIRSRIREVLDRSPAIDPLTVDVDVDGGVVHLHGQVGSYAEKLAALELATGVVAASRIRNELVTRPYGHDEISDEAIVVAVRDRLADMASPSVQVDVEVDHHVVTLRGRVASTAERAVVRHVVESVAGVTFVRNEIAVGGETP